MDAELHAFMQQERSKARAQKRKRKASQRRTGEKAVKKGRAFVVSEELAELQRSDALYTLHSRTTDELKVEYPSTLWSTPTTLWRTPTTLWSIPNTLWSAPTTLWSTPTTLWSTPTTPWSTPVASPPAPQGMCEDNGLLRSGPKYVLVTRLMEHAKLGTKKQQVTDPLHQGSS